ncbi:hypothetical protein KJ671_04025 [Patescibacteria group bacterium]|nr:hypothetical protein [Patescibacteria group bacterium]
MEEKKKNEKDKNLKLLVIFVYGSYIMGIEKVSIEIAIRREIKGNLLFKIIEGLEEEAKTIEIGCGFDFVDAKWSVFFENKIIDSGIISLK